MLSIVIPSYNEENLISNTVRTLKRVLTGADIDYELVFVNDGSTDNTQQRIEDASGDDPKIRFVCFSKNFGKEAAIFAGLAAAKGECVAVMDCDLQHPPATLVEMYGEWRKGYEVVEGVKRSRGEESGAHKFSAETFYKLMSGATGIDMSRASDFKLLDRKAVDALLSFPEYHVFFRALSSLVGFKKTTVEFDVAERTEGESKWSTKSLIKYALNNIVEYSAFPLHIVTWAGILTLIVSGILGIETIVRYFLGNAAEGFTTVILLQLFTGSIIMIGIGILGFYLSKVYDEVKRRPRYIISKMN